MIVSRTVGGTQLRRLNPVRVTRCFYHTPRTPQSTPPEITELLSTYNTAAFNPIPLSKLLSLGNPPTPSSVLKSASYVLSELPRRLSLRVAAMDALPFIVGTNPFVSRIRQLDKSSFHELATHPDVESVETNANFSRALEALVEAHGNDIPIMARGFQECTRYMSSAAIALFLDEAIRSRIGIRLIAEQHISISRALESPSHWLHEDRSKGRLGVIHMHCSPSEMIKMCGSFVSELCEATLGVAPRLEIDGEVDATFAYVPVHLEYIMTEILKNSFRAVVERHSTLQNPKPSSALPPVLVTISPSPDFLSIRIRDEGGGVPPNQLANIFTYSFTTAGRYGRKNNANDPDDMEDDGGPYAAQHIGGSAAIGGENDGNLFSEITGKGLQTGMGTIAGLGYGLPLARLYATYLGGSLELVSLYGHGTDVFIKLKRMDKGTDVEI